MAAGASGSGGGAGAGLPVVGVRPIEGRTGTTLLMQLLGSSPAVVFDARYPAEYRFLSYFAKLAAQMTEPFDPARHLGVTPFFFGPQPSWGPVPFESDVIDVGSLQGPLLRSMWRAWSEAVQSARPGARYYAEKLAVPAEVVRAAGVDLRVIDLVRDPRDVLASIRAFVAARGVDGLGRQPGQPEHEFVAGFIDRMRSQLSRLAGAPDGGDGARLLLRYEDFVTDLPGAATRLGAWLGIELDAEVVLAARPSYRHHLTTASVEASIGRWRRDLPPADAERINAALASLLAEFGYD